MAELDLDIFDLAHARAVRVVFAVLRLSLALSILVSTFAYAEDGGKVTGTLTDQTGAVVPSAEVDLANKSTGVAQHTKTGPDGAYIFPLVPVGVYTLAVHAAGFKPVERDAMSVNIHSMVQQDLTLEVGNEAGIDNWDLALLKTIPFTEARALELRLETFNTFNHTQFDGANSVNGNFTSSSFGQVVSSASPRIAQVAAKFTF